MNKTEEALAMSRENFKIIGNAIAFVAFSITKLETQQIGVEMAILGSSTFTKEQYSQILAAVQAYLDHHKNNADKLVDNTRRLNN